MVDPTSGVVAAAQFGDIRRTDSAKSLGVNILGAVAESEEYLEVDYDSMGTIIRVALDDAFRRMLPQVDAALRSRVGQVTTGQIPSTPPATTTTQQPDPSPKFCYECGNKLTNGSKFYPNCGKKLN